MLLKGHEKGYKTDKNILYCWSVSDKIRQLNYMATACTTLIMNGLIAAAASSVTKVYKAQWHTDAQSIKTNTK